MCEDFPPKKMTLFCIVKGRYNKLLRFAGLCWSMNAVHRPSLSKGVLAYLYYDTIYQMSWYKVCLKFALFLQ